MSTSTHGFRPEDLYVVLSLSTAKVTLGRARSILLLAQQFPANEETLSACAVILLVVVLEQVTKTKLSHTGECQKLDETIGLQADEVLEESLYYRVTLLPTILSDGRFEFNRSSQLAKDLRELIALRNKLIHIEEYPTVLRGTAQNVNLNNHTLQVSIPLPDDSWSFVSVEKAQQYLEVVELYLHEVFEPEEIYQGKLVRQVR